MSRSQGLLHGDQLLGALTQTALEVQRARTVAGVLAAACNGLEGLGFSVAIVTLVDDSFWFRHVSARTPLEQAVDALLPSRRAGLGGRLSPMLQALTREEAAYLDDFHAMVNRAPQGAGPLKAALVGRLPRRGMMAPLHVRREHWGVLMAVHDDARAEDTALLRLFALQLGSAVEVAEGFETLARRNAELELVHELAIAGPLADSRALARRALETLCRTATSDCAVLHRFDAESGEFVQVGDALGYAGPLLETYRRFRVAPADVVAQRPLALPARDVPGSGPGLVAEGLQHLAITPLFIEGRPAGMLVLARRHDTPYTEAEVRTAEILGVQMASQLERARLSDEAKRLYGDLKRSYDELARTQQELVRHERLAALGELAAVMAHEVRNPLGVIFNSLTTLKRLLTPSGDAEMLLNMVGEEADRLNRIVGDLLDFVRPYELEKRPTAVEPIVTGAVDAATHAAVNPAVGVVTEFPRELPPFPLDGHLLKQALVNLIVNAAQAMPRGGTVLVRALVEQVNGAPWLCLEVRDEGVGLTPRAAEKMFQPFFTTKATGTGLGLAVVKRIVDAHLGEVTARGNAGGQGTTFTMRFPHTREARAGALTPPRASASAQRG